MYIKSYEELSHTFTLFAEAAVHLILYTRELYPNELFEKRLLFGVPVHRCRHPLVSDYVKQIMDSLKPLLISGALESIAVLIFKDGGSTGSRESIERFVLAFDWLKEINPNADISLKREELEGVLRSFLLKVTVADALLQPLPQGSPFEIVINLAKDLEGEDAETLVSEECPWVLLDKPDFESSTLTPLKDLSTNLFRIKLFVEERK